MNGALTELLERCRAAGLALLVEGHSLHVNFETDPPNDLIEEIQRHKPEVMAAPSSGPVRMAEVIAPARWVPGAGGNCCPRASFRDAVPRASRRTRTPRRRISAFCVESPLGRLWLVPR